MLPPGFQTVSPGSGVLDLLHAGQVQASPSLIIPGVGVGVGAEI